MRLDICGPVIMCGLSTVLLSGCSWLGYGASSQYETGAYQAQSGAYYNNTAYNGGQNGHAAYGMQSAQHNASQQQMGQQQMGQHQMGQQHTGQQHVNSCQISSPTQRIPQGCAQENVTLAVGGAQGYGQQAQYTSGSYGSHAGGNTGGNVQTSTQYHTEKSPKFKRPKLRGSLGLEFDHSVSGNLYAPATSPAVAGYDRALFAEGIVTPTVTTDYTSSDARLGRVIAPEISFDDVYTAPLRITGGAEYIFSDHATVFANAGYTRAEGKKGGSVEINEELLRTVTTGGVSQTTFIPNETVAAFDYEFNDLERIDLEAGGRYYFNPILADKMSRTITPFVSASGGAARYSETTVRESQRQRYLQRAFEGTQVNPTGDFYDVSFGTPVQIYDAQWVPYGSVKAGVEWQMTPRTALAFETGLKYEGNRDLSDGTKGDANVTFPIAIRGSYNF